MKIKFFEKDPCFYDFGIIICLFGDYKAFGIEILGWRIIHIANR